METASIESESERQVPSHEVSNNQGRIGCRRVRGYSSVGPDPQEQILFLAPVKGLEGEEPTRDCPASGLEQAAPNVSEIHPSVISLSSMAAAVPAA